MIVKLIFFVLWLVFLICLSAFCDKAEAKIYCYVETRQNNETYLVCKDYKNDKEIPRIRGKVCQQANR